jgi:hypothetical protein
MVSANNYTLSVKVQNNQLVFYQPNNESQNQCSISFHRTLRIPDDGKTYPLPPSLGNFSLNKVDDYLDRVPEEWKKTGGIFICMHQREAMWMQFKSARERPKALKVGVGKVNAINGENWSNDLHEKDYVTIPKQPWLDGINAGGKGTIKQFVAMPLGSGYSVEAQVTGKEEFGGIQFMVFDPIESKRLQKFPKQVLQRKLPVSMSNMKFKKCCSTNDSYFAKPQASLCRLEKEAASEMSISTGGSMKQEISKDPYGLSFWDQSCFGRVYVRIVNSEMYENITGKKAPACPISAQTYSSYGYPWYNVYNESASNSIDQSNKLNQVQSVKQIDQQKYAWPQQNDSTVHIPASQVKPIYHAASIRDGDW